MLPAAPVTATRTGSFNARSLLRSGGGGAIASTLDGYIRDVPIQVGGEVGRVARERLGLDVLRPGQQEAVEAVISGRDTLAIMPTGSGKSAIYQIASALLPGPTVVVSPLIALQRDQVEAITGADIGDAAAANSTIGT